MKVSEAANALGVTPRRVRAMIADGRIDAHREGRAWHIDRLVTPKSRRALSLRSWQMLALALKHRSLEGLNGHDKQRTASRIHQLRASVHPARLLAEWKPSSPHAQDAFLTTLGEHVDILDDEYVRVLLRKRPEYLRDSRDLAQIAASERTVLGYSRAELGELAGVPATVVRDVESGNPPDSPGQLRKLLRALEIEPTALPNMVLS